MRRDARWADFVECGRKLRVARDRAFHLVSERRERAVRGELPEAREIPFGEWRGERRLGAMAIVRGCRAQSSNRSFTARRRPNCAICSSARSACRAVSSRSGWRRRCRRCSQPRPPRSARNVRDANSSGSRDRRGHLRADRLREFQGRGHEAERALQGRRLGSAPGPLGHGRQWRRRAKEFAESAAACSRGAFTIRRRRATSNAGCRAGRNAWPLTPTDAAHRSSRAARRIAGRARPRRVRAAAARR